MKQCLNCGKKLKGKYQLKFCNHRCSAIYNNKKRKVIKYCLFCGEELSKIQSTYCNNRCQQDFQWKQRKIVAENDNIDSLNGQYERRNLAKRFLIEKYGDKCIKCDWSEINIYTEKVPIELEHKDGNSDNWKLDNLELLCPSCHSLTKTYKGANRGNGRYARRQRYRDGKSF